MSSRIYSLLFSITLLFLSGVAGGCRTVSDEKQAEMNETAEAIQKRTTKIPVGTIHLVDPEMKFVLIRSSRFTDVEPESDLLVMNDQGTQIAKLRASPARKGSFLTADIVFGTPQPGNHVLLVHRPKVNSPEAETVPGNEVQILE